MGRNYLNRGLTLQVREYLFIYEVIPSCGWSSSIEKAFFSDKTNIREFVYEIIF